MRPVIDAKRTVPATPFNWKGNDYPDYGEPGAGGRHAADCYVFACPGCGRFSGITVGHPKPAESPSWDVAAGSLDDVTSLTLMPSINCVGCCGWHGYLRGGVFVSC